MRSIGVLWGFATTAGIKAQKPTAVAETPEDIIKIIEEL
jgi:phosphoglycolate phosphatase-like HAD superfamily hydrolase